ncbi:hypothetical protein Tco_1238911 [Tanacetum coccineum]
MVVAAVKHMALNFSKLDKFKGVDFRRWQKKMHFLISSMNVVYVLTSPILEDGENATMDQIRRRNKWENDDYVCKGLILNGMPDPLFDIYQNFKSSKELWDSFKAKYMAKDASSKKFLISNFTNYKMTNSRPVMEQYNELLGILGRFTQHKINMDEVIQLGSHLRIEESLRAQDSDKPKRNNVAGPLVVNMLENNNSFRYNDNKGKRKHHDTKADPNKKSKDDDVAWWVDLEATMHVCKDRCWLKTYESLNDGSILHMRNESTALVYGHGCVYLRFSSGKIVSLFNVLHVPNIRKILVSSSILNNCAFMSSSKQNNSILWHARLGQVHFKGMQDMSKDGDAIFDENRFSLVPRPSQRSLMNRTEDIGALVVPEEDDPKTFDEAMKSQDIEFWKETINDEIDSILGNNT